MNEFSLTDNQRKVLNVAYWMTFYSLLLHLLFFFLAMVANVADLVKLDGPLYFSITSFFTVITLGCVLTMMSYPAIYLSHLWRKHERKKVAVGILVFFFLHILTGYLWYYQREIKKKEIHTFFRL